MNKLAGWIREWNAKRKGRAQSPLRRKLNWIGRAAATLVCLHLLCISFPQPLFAYQLSAGRITLYSTEPIQAPAGRRVLARAEGLIAHSELFDPAAKFRVFLCNNPGVYRLFAPRAGGAFGVSYGVGRNVFIARADVTCDQAFRQGTTNTRRSLSGLIAHELTHQMIARRIGIIRERLLPSWKAEGYCEMIANNCPFDALSGLELIRNGQGDPSMPFWYFKNLQIITFLMRERGMSYEAIMKARIDPEQVLKDLAVHLNAPERNM